ncbi:type II toxin-antitoxin system HicB family antitoxin [Desulfonema magnum]|uniref:Toxin-antitoxin system, antitoxin component, HigB domain-containing protein n=1 Tax=Desulfonema magnum TaxID=45655 RepID=A0A975GTC2_9BACT|nr:type II toxin-antitoxin system HicB family antitoxin [Desulfonema magnum]QTA92970.1 Toxin-antitoxin system, antitoxin component, HigB domain-containing protein [Desulfonema magnum]
MELKIVIEPDEDVFVAYCPQLPGCVSYGKDEAETIRNIREAIDLYLRPIPRFFEKLPENAKILEIAV